MLALLAAPLATGQGSECSGGNLSPDPVYVGPEAGSGTLSFIGPGGCPYGVSSDASWVQVGVTDITASDERSIPIPYSYDANPDAQFRAGRVFVYGYGGYGGDSSYFEQAAAGSRSSRDAAPLGDPAAGSGDGPRGLGGNEEPGFEAPLVLAAVVVVALTLARPRR